MELLLFFLLVALSGQGGGSAGGASTSSHGWAVGPNCQTLALVDTQAWADASAEATQRLILEEGITQPAVLLRRLLREYLPQCEHLADQWLAQNPVAKTQTQQLINAIRDTPHELVGRTAVLTEPGFRWEGPYPMLRAAMLLQGLVSLVTSADLLGVGGRVVEGNREVRRLS